MNPTTYLLIAYDAGSNRPKSLSNPKPLAITEQEFTTLKTDHQCSLHLNDVLCEIAEKRFIEVESTGGKISIVIIDFKREQL